jgi:hypothetical protein
MIKGTVYRQSNISWWQIEFEVDGVKYKSHRCYQKEKRQLNIKTQYLKSVRKTKTILKNSDKKNTWLG